MSAPAANPIDKAGHETALAKARRAREAWQRARTVIRDLRARETVPATWKRIQSDDFGGMYVDRESKGALKVIESVLPYGPDDELWYHVSFSRPNRMPTWDDVQRVRRDFIGEDRECYQVFPTRDRYVSDHTYCLHLWYAVDRPRGVLPDLRIGGTI